MTIDPIAAAAQELAQDPDITILDGTLTEPPASVTPETVLSDDSDTEAPVASVPTPPASEATATYVKALADLRLRAQEVLAIPPTGWKPLLKHRSGTSVSSYRQPGERIPIVRGQLDIHGHTIEQVWGIMKDKALWDDWFERGEHLADIDASSSLTYLAMKSPIPSITSRDFVLVENLSVPVPGEILFSSASVRAPHIPVASGHARGRLYFHACHLSVLPEGGTRVIYFIQIGVRTWFPGRFSQALVARRPLILSKLAQYLHHYGPAPQEPALTKPKSQTLSQAPRPDMARLSPSPIPTFTPTPTRQATAPAILESPRPKVTITSAQGAESPHESPRRITLATAYEQVGEAWKRCQEDGWPVGLEVQGVKVLTPPTSQPPSAVKSTSIMRSSIIVEGVRVEEVAAVVRSLDCRRVWDERFEGGKLIKELDQARSHLHLLEIKGAFPVSARDMAVVTDMRAEPNGTLIHLATSTEDPAIPLNPQKVRAHLDFAAWILEPLPQSHSLSTPAIRITFLERLHLRGSVPESMARNARFSHIANSVWGLQSFLTTWSPPPYLARSTLLLRREAYRADEAHWEMEVSTAGTAGRSGCEVHVPRAWGDRWWVKAVAASTPELKGAPAAAEEGADGDNITPCPLSTPADPYQGKAFSIRKIAGGFRLVIDSTDPSIRDEGATVVVRVSGVSVPANLATAPIISTSPTTPASSWSIRSTDSAYASGSSTLTQRHVAKKGDPSAASTRGRIPSDMRNVPRPTPVTASSSAASTSSAFSSISASSALPPTRATTFQLPLLHRPSLSRIPTSPLTQTPVEEASIWRGPRGQRFGHRRTLTFTQPSLPVRAIRWAGFEDGQVLGVLIGVVVAFYMGLLYERFILQGVLSHW